MPGYGVDIVFTPPLKFIEAQADGFRNALYDFDTLFQSFGPILAEMEQQQFSTEGQGAWPPLVDSTIREKERLGFPPDTLIRTRQLVDSLTDPVSALHVTGAEAWYGTEVEYAHWHQTGGYLPGRPPQRQVIPDPIPIDTRRQIETAQIQWINAVAAQTFGKAA